MKGFNAAKTTVLLLLYSFDDMTVGLRCFDAAKVQEQIQHYTSNILEQSSIRPLLDASVVILLSMLYAWTEYQPPIRSSLVVSQQGR